jgi:hypothetical protein
MKDQVIEEIKRLCGKVEWMPGLGYYYMINDTLCLYMYCRGNGSLRFAIPYLATTTDDNKEKMMTLINQANREVKYIKATLLDNGSLTLTYDHKMVSGEKPKDVVPHIIKALGFASSYIKEKIENDK